MVHAISVYSAGVPYAARACHTQRGRAIRSVLYCSGKSPATLGYVSVLEFFSIESYLKAFRRTMDQTKSIELQKKRLDSVEERARSRASSACAQTR